MIPKRIVTTGADTRVEAATAVAGVVAAEAAATRAETASAAAAEDIRNRCAGGIRDKESEGVLGALALGVNSMPEVKANSRALYFWKKRTLRQYGRCKDVRHEVSRTIPRVPVSRSGTVTA